MDAVIAIVGVKRWSSSAAATVRSATEPPESESAVSSVGQPADFLFSDLPGECVV